MPQWCGETLSVQLAECREVIVPPSRTPGLPAPAELPHREVLIRSGAPPDADNVHYVKFYPIRVGIHESLEGAELPSRSAATPGSSGAAAAVLTTTASTGDLRMPVRSARGVLPLAFGASI